MKTRVAKAGDIPALMNLYHDLVGDASMAGPEGVTRVINHPGTQIFCVETLSGLAAMATLHLLPNVTQGGRPYALIENVVTSEVKRKQGFGRTVMCAVIDAAWTADAYKIMLMTGRSADAKGFYEKLGFSADEKWGMTLRRAPLRDI